LTQQRIYYHRRRYGLLLAVGSLLSTLRSITLAALSL
jgi:hypothetical protein